MARAPGVMHGLMRVRGFTQDDAHVFCLPEQISDEILKILDLTERILSAFDFSNYEINLSTRPEKSIGEDAVWDLATKGLIEALERKGWAYKIDEGGGAFYGPKIDLKIEDAIGRMWQCSTIQLDFNLPERFELDYIAADGSKQPIMIHRAIFGSLERFFGIMTENYAGDSRSGWPRAGAPAAGHRRGPALRRKPARAADPGRGASQHRSQRRPPRQADPHR